MDVFQGDVDDISSILFRVTVSVGILLLEAL